MCFKKFFNKTEIYLKHFLYYGFFQCCISEDRSEPLPQLLLCLNIQFAVLLIVFVSEPMKGKQNLPHWGSIQFIFIYQFISEYLLNIWGSEGEFVLVLAFYIHLCDSPLPFQTHFFPSSDVFLLCYDPQEP